MTPPSQVAGRMTRLSEDTRTKPSGGLERNTGSSLRRPLRVSLWPFDLGFLGLRSSTDMAAKRRRFGLGISPLREKGSNLERASEKSNVTSQGISVFFRASMLMMMPFAFRG